MKVSKNVAVLLMSMAGLGCTSYPGDPLTQYSITHRTELNRQMAKTVWNEQTANAIVSQRALYPYHFAPGSPELNSLGRRDLKVLASRYGGNLHQLSLAQGDASQALYEARRACVATYLAELGVELPLDHITQYPPGGDGVGTTGLLDRSKKFDEQTTGRETLPAGQGYATSLGR